MNTNHGFTAKTITLTQAIVDEPILTHQWLGEAIQAKALLQAAEQTREQMLAQAKIEIATEKTEARQQASEQVFNNANQLIAHWEQQKQQQLNDLLPEITEIIKQALEKLLINQPPKEQLETLIQQLMQSQKQQNKPATLYFAPQQQAEIEQLQTHHHLNHWQLQPDPKLSNTQLRLEDDQGLFQASLELNLAAIEKQFHK